MASRGELEQRILELLWAANGPQTVAEVHTEMCKERELAYTTVMTVLARLAKKDMVRRELVGRAWSYEPADPQPVFVAKILVAQLEGLDDATRAQTLREFAARVGDADREALRG